MLVGSLPFCVGKTFIKTLKEYTRGLVEATIEDLAFGVWSSREVDKVDLRVCLSEASYAAAEKTERRMA